jgi:broad specificity phosphatase PhoE
VRLFIVRHGQTDWNREPARCQGWADVELNETGRAQAQERGRALAGHGVELVVTSHLKRAAETAAIVRRELQAADGRELQLIVDPRLAETHRGDWETRRFSEIMSEEPLAWRAYREHPEMFRFPSGESLSDQQRRVLAAVRDVVRDGRSAVLVTHNGSIRVLRCFLEGGGIAAFHSKTTHNGAVDEIAADGLEPRIDEFLGAG